MKSSLASFENLHLILNDIYSHEKEHVSLLKKKVYSHSNIVNPT